MSIAWEGHRDVEMTYSLIQVNAKKSVYSSSSSSPPSSLLAAAAARLRLTRSGRPPPYGEARAKSTCFCESRRTTNDGTLTTWFPTYHSLNTSQMITSNRLYYLPNVALRMNAVKSTQWHGSAVNSPRWHGSGNAKINVQVLRERYQQTHFGAQGERVGISKKHG